MIKDSYKKKCIESEHFGKVYVLKCSNLHKALYAVKNPVKVLKQLSQIHPLSEKKSQYEFAKTYDKVIEKYKSEITNRLNVDDLQRLKRKHIQIVYDETKSEDINPEYKTIIRRGKNWYAIYLQENNVDNKLIIGGNNETINNKRQNSTLEADDDQALINHIDENVESNVNKRVIDYLNPTYITRNKYFTYLKNMLTSSGGNNEKINNKLKELGQIEEEQNIAIKINEEQNTTITCSTDEIDDNIEELHHNYYTVLNQSLDELQVENDDPMKVDEPRKEVGPIRRSARLKILQEKKEYSKENQITNGSPNRKKTKPNKAANIANKKVEQDEIAMNKDEIAIVINQTVDPTEDQNMIVSIYQNQEIETYLKHLYVLDSVHDIFDRDILNKIINTTNKKGHDIISIFARTEKNVITPKKFIEGLFGGENNTDSHLKTSIDEYYEFVMNNVISQAASVFNRDINKGIEKYHENDIRKVLDAVDNAKTNHERLILNPDVYKTLRDKYPVKKKGTKNPTNPTEDKSKARFDKIKENLFSSLLTIDRFPSAPLTNDRLQCNLAADNLSLDTDCVLKWIDRFNENNHDSMYVCIDAIKGSFKETIPDQLYTQLGKSNNTENKKNVQVLTPAMLIDPATTTKDQDYKFLLVNFKIDKIPQCKLRYEHLKITFLFKEIQITSAFEIEMFFFNDDHGTDEYKYVYSKLAELVTPNTHPFVYIDISNLSVFDNNVFLLVKPTWIYAESQRKPYYISELLICSNKKSRNQSLQYMEKSYKYSSRKKFTTKESWGGMTVNDCIIEIKEIFGSQHYIFTEKSPDFIEQNLRHLWLHLLDWKRMGDSIQISYIKEYYCQIGERIKNNINENYPIIVFTSQDIFACCIARMRKIPVLFNSASSIRYYFDFPVYSEHIENSNKDEKITAEYHYLQYLNNKLSNLLNVSGSDEKELIDQFVDGFHKWRCSIKNSFASLENQIEEIKKTDQLLNSIYSNNTKYEQHLRVSDGQVDIHENKKKKYEQYILNTFELSKSIIQAVLDKMNSISSKSKSKDGSISGDQLFFRIYNDEKDGEFVDLEQDLCNYYNPSPSELNNDQIQPINDLRADIKNKIQNGI